MLVLENLVKEYDAPTKEPKVLVAADHLTLRIAEGECFGLIGPNGAGKTTTLKMICGLTAPTSGRVEVNGVDLQKNPFEAQKHIGYLSDFFSLYDDLKVWEYLDFFAHAYKLDEAAIPGRIKEVIALMNLESKTDALISGLSRGMKQRLGIGRAIIHDPRLLILDEPAAGLDPRARLELKVLLQEFHRRGKTILVTSHILSDLEEICTSVAILEQGRLLRVGKLNEVLERRTTARKFRLKLSAPVHELQTALSTRPGVANVSGSNIAAEFEFSGMDSAVASLLRSLIESGAAVCEFTEIQESLESVYSRLSSGEVM